MDETTRTALQALLVKPLAELTLGEAIFAMTYLDGLSDEEIGQLAGFTPPEG